MIVIIGRHGLGEKKSADEWMLIDWALIYQQQEETSVRSFIKEQSIQ